MKYLIIDDNKQFAEALCKQLLKNVEAAEIDKSCNDKVLEFSNEKKSIAIDFSKHTAREISDAVIETYDPAKNGKLILFINVNLELGKDSRKLQKGIELLIWLRIKGVMNHCVLYSFEDLHSILNREPKHLIATSQGTTFVRLPCNFCRLNINSLTGQLAVKENSIEVLKSRLNLASLRHIFANIWAFENLIDIHNEINARQKFEMLTDRESINDLDYNIAKFCLMRNKGVLNEGSRKTILAIQAKLKIDKSQKKILYIDDRADKGWFGFLKHLLPNSVTFDFIKPETNDNVNSLIEKFDNKNKNGDIEYIIMDMRLLPSEDYETEYDNFVSTQFIKRITDDPRYRKIKFALFTASNQLANYKNMLGKNRYTPNTIFIKEGFDFQYTPNHRSNSYKSLLYFLNQILRDKHRKIDGGVERVNVTEEKIIDAFIEHLQQNSWTKQLNQLMFDLKEYDYIIPDTNMFMVEKPLIPLLKSEKVIVTYPVWKELQRNSGEASELSKDFFGWYFKNTIVEPCVDKKSISQDSITKIDRNQNGSKADDYFEEILLHYSKNCFGKVLFLTNDVKAKVGDKDGKAPIRLVTDWINQNNIKNVDVGTFFKAKISYKDGYKSAKTAKGSEGVSFVKDKNLQAKPTISTKSKQPTLISWKDCKLDEKTYLLTFELNGKYESLTIGKGNRPGFVGAFNRLIHTEETFQLQKNNDSFTIHGFANILAKVKRESPNTP